MAQPDDVVNLQDKLAQVTEQWTPGTVAEANDWQFKVVKIAGRFVWHSHEVDEVFLVLNGDVVIELEDRPSVHLQEGELFVVPRGVRHCPDAPAECQLLLIEPAGVRNTGTHGGSRTVDQRLL